MDLKDNRSLRYALQCVQKKQGASPAKIGIAISVLQHLEDMDLVAKDTEYNKWYLTPQGKVWLTNDRISRSGSRS